MPEAKTLSTTDQASGLRQLFASKGLRILPMASATSHARQPRDLAHALAAGGTRVLVTDHEWTARAHAHQNELPSLPDVLAGRIELSRLAREISPGVRWMPLVKGFTAQDAAGANAHAMFARLHQLADPVDVILLATIHPQRIAPFLDPGSEFVVVVGGSPEALTSAYKMVKRLVTRGCQPRLIIEGASDEAAAERRFRRIAATAHRFLGVVPLMGGWLGPSSTRSFGNGAANNAMHWMNIARASRQWHLTSQGDPTHARAERHNAGPSPAHASLAHSNGARSGAAVSRKAFGMTQPLALGSH